MARYRCNACQGEFSSPTPDGSIYFHACPPLSPAEIMARVKDGRLAASPAIQADVDLASTVVPEGEDVPPKVQAAHARLAQLHILREGHVDQNLAQLRWKDPEERKPLPRKADGAGVVEVPAV